MAYYHNNWLLREGLTNANVDYNDMMDETRRLSRKAYCGSQHCAKGGDNYRLVHKPRVGETKWNCPDCGHVLFWETKRGKKH